LAFLVKRFNALSQPFSDFYDFSTDGIFLTGLPRNFLGCPFAAPLPVATPLSASPRRLSREPEDKVAKTFGGCVERI
jgi:hypothetical protein